MNFDRIKRYVNSFLLIVFFVFTVSDLIEMHLRVIFKIEIHQDHYFSNKIGKTKKQKNNISKLKNQHNFGFLFLHTGIFQIKKLFFCKFHYVNSPLKLAALLSKYKNLTLRAPPAGKFLI